MRPWTAPAWRVDSDAQSQVARARLDDGGDLSVRFLSPTMARVSLRPASGWKEPRTWAIAPQAAPQAGIDVPWEGRDRDDLAGFTLPATSAREDRFGTAELSVRLLPGEPRLQWTAFGASTPVLQDRETSAYLRQGRGGLVRDYVAREQGEHFFGLGD